MGLRFYTLMIVSLLICGCHRELIRESAAKSDYQDIRSISDPIARACVKEIEREEIGVGCRAAFDAGMTTDSYEQCVSASISAKAQNYSQIVSDDSKLVCTCVSKELRRKLSKNEFSAAKNKADTLFQDDQNHLHQIAQQSISSCQASRNAG